MKDLDNFYLPITIEDENDQLIEHEDADVKYAGKITGTLIQSYLVCPRQSWLMSRQMIPDQDNEFLEIGRLIQAQTYARQKKEVLIGHLKIDVLFRGNKRLVIGEVKKTSKASEVARIQLAFYLYELRQIGVEAEGELLFPEERGRETIILNDQLIKEIETLKHKLSVLLSRPYPPPPQRIPRCKHCAYAEFCWA